jgi:phospho-N-acetylmuramoyl-pentapeptide-transferase
MLYWLADFSGTIGVVQRVSLSHGAHRRLDVTRRCSCFLFGPWIIDHLRLRQARASRSARTGRLAPANQARHADDGRLMILSGVTVSALLWANPSILMSGSCSA